jgi:archaellin
MKNGYQNEATLEHDKKIEGISLVESWLVESREKDKSKLYNMTLPLGSWAGVFKIDNDQMWVDYIKTGKVKGISIEGVFEHLEKTSPERKQSAMLMESFADYIMQKDIHELSQKEAEYVLFKIKEAVELESFTDYGDDVKNNAKRGIELNEKNNNKCATQTGKVRAQQLANGEPISIETIKRMHSYLSRAETYYDESDTSACGTISYLLWGGKSALSWSRNK